MNIRNFNGHVFWVFGLSGAGKSTLASGLIADLRAKNIPVLALDGDELRKGLSKDLGFSANDRTENIRRAAEAARLGLDSGLCVVASFITPLESQRVLLRDRIGAGCASLIFADAPLMVCRQRDPKGLYAKAEAGQLKEMTGIGSAFETPDRVDLRLATATEAPSVSVRTLVNFAWHRLA